MQYDNCKMKLLIIWKRVKQPGPILDLKEAFDAVDPTILLKKTLKLWNPWPPLTAFQKLSHKLNQYTVVNKAKSEISLVKCGVPKGPH